MVMARKHVRVSLTSILYICKVFKHLLMQCMVLLTSQRHGGGLSTMEDKGQQWRSTRNKGEYEDNDDERQGQGTMLNKRQARMKDNNEGQ